MDELPHNVASLSASNNGPKPNSSAWNVLTPLRWAQGMLGSFSGRSAWSQRPLQSEMR